MSASYKKLWKILIDRDMNKSDLIRQAKITSNIVAKMGKGEDVSMESLGKICIALDCEIGDIMDVNAGAGKKLNDYQKLRTIHDAIGGLLQDEGTHEGGSRWLRVIYFFVQSGNS